MAANIHPSRLSNIGISPTSANMNNDFYAAERDSNNHNRTRKREEQPRYQVRSSRKSNRAGRGNNRSDDRPQHSGNRTRDDSRREDSAIGNVNETMPRDRRSGPGRGRGRRNNAGHRTKTTNSRLLNGRNNFDHSSADADHSANDNDRDARLVATIKADQARERERERRAAAPANMSGNRNPFNDEQTIVPTDLSANQNQFFGGGHMNSHQQGQRGQRRGGRGGRGGAANGDRQQSCTFCSKRGHTEDVCWEKHPHLGPNNRNTANQPQQSSGFGQPSNGRGFGASQQAVGFPNASSQAFGTGSSNGANSQQRCPCRNPNHTPEQCWKLHRELEPPKRGRAQAQNNGNGKWCSHCNMANHATEDCWFKDLQRNAQSTAQVDNMEIDGEPSRPGCTYCGRPNHVVDDCRTRKRDGAGSNQRRLSTLDDHMVNANPLGLTNGDGTSQGWALEHQQGDYSLQQQRLAAERSNAQTQQLVPSGPLHFNSLEEMDNRLGLRSLVAEHMRKVDRVEVIIPQPGQYILPPDRPLFDIEGDLVMNGGMVVAENDCQQVVHMPQSVVPEQIMHMPQIGAHVPQSGPHQPITLNFINNITTNSHNVTNWTTPQDFPPPACQVEEVEDEEDDVVSDAASDSQVEYDDEEDEEDIEGEEVEEETDEDGSHTHTSSTYSEPAVQPIPQKSSNATKSLAHSAPLSSGEPKPPAFNMTSLLAKKEKLASQEQHAPVHVPTQSATHSHSHAPMAVAPREPPSVSVLPPVPTPAIPAASHKVMPGHPQHPTPQQATSTTPTSTPPKRPREENEPDTELPALKKLKFSQTEMELALFANNSNIFAASAQLETQAREEPAPHPLRSLRETTSVLDPLQQVKAPILPTFTPQPKAAPALTRTPTTMQPQDTSTQSSIKSKRRHVEVEEVEDTDEAPVPSPVSSTRPLAEPTIASYSPTASFHKRKRPSEVEDEHEQQYAPSTPLPPLAEPQAQQDVSHPPQKRVQFEAPVEELQVPNAFPQELLRKLGDHGPGKPSITNLLYPPGQPRRLKSPPPPKRTPGVPRSVGQNIRQLSPERAPVPVYHQPQKPVAVNHAPKFKTVRGDHQLQAAVVKDARQSSALGALGTVTSGVGGALLGAYRWCAGGA